MYLALIKKITTNKQKDTKTTQCYNVISMIITLKEHMHTNRKRATYRHYIILLVISSTTSKSGCLPGFVRNVTFQS